MSSGGNDCCLACGSYLAGQAFRKWRIKRLGAACPPTSAIQVAFSSSTSAIFPLPRTLLRLQPCVTVMVKAAVAVQQGAARTGRSELSADSAGLTLAAYDGQIAAAASAWTAGNMLLICDLICMR